MSLTKICICPVVPTAGCPFHGDDVSVPLVAADGSNDLREEFAREMIKRGLATGHGDTLADLHHELWWQFDEIRNNNNQAES